MNLNNLAIIGAELTPFANSTTNLTSPLPLSSLMLTIPSIFFSSQSLSISSIKDSFETLYGILVYTILSFPFFVSILYSALTLALPLPVV